MSRHTHHDINKTNKALDGTRFKSTRRRVSQKVSTFEFPMPNATGRQCQDILVGKGDWVQRSSHFRAFKIRKKRIRSEQTQGLFGTGVPRLCLANSECRGMYLVGCWPGTFRESQRPSYLTPEQADPKPLHLKLNQAGP